MVGRFIGRTAELQALQNTYDREGFHMAVIYGRRGVGKTTLVNQFTTINTGKTLFFEATESNAGELLRSMGDAVLRGLGPSHAGTMGFGSFEEVFDFVAEVAKQERVILVFDEFTYLAKACPYLPSLLQKYIDRDWKQTNLFFILLSSCVPFMEEHILAMDTPLFCRSDLQFKLKPFGYKETSLFVPRFNNEEKALVYGLTSGITNNLAQFDDAISLDQNIIDLFFTRTAYFTDEQVSTILSIGTPSYHMILAAIAEGKTTYREISETSGIQEIDSCLENLLNEDIIERGESPKLCYLVNFWFAAVCNGLSSIHAGKGERYYRQWVKPRLYAYMGKVFEEMAKQFVYMNTWTNVIPYVVTDIVSSPTEQQDR